MKLNIASAFLALSGIVGLVEAVDGSLSLDLSGGTASRSLQEGVCADSFQAADIVILFDESGSMEEEQDAAADATVTLFDAFAAQTGSRPRFAVGGFGRNGSNSIFFGNSRIREVTSDFVTSASALKKALDSLVTNGDTEEGYEAIYDVFTSESWPRDTIVGWNFQEDAPTCVLVFTDEDSDGFRSAQDVNRVKGSNAIIPIVNAGGYEYSAVSSLPNNAVLSLDTFRRNPFAYIPTIVDACVTSIAPKARCKNVVRPHDGTCGVGVNAEAFNAGSTDPNGDVLSFSVSPPRPYSVTGTSTITDVILSVKDPKGNCDTCTANIEVTNQGPTARCQDITREVDSTCTWEPPHGMASIIGGASSDPENGELSLSFFPNGPFVGIGDNQVDLTAIDCGGLSDTCITTVTLVDNTPPSIECPYDILVQADEGNPSAVVSFAPPAAADNCQGATASQIGGIASGDSFPIGSTSVIWQATDASGNTKTCEFKVVVEPSTTTEVSTTTEESVTTSSKPEPGAFDDPHFVTWNGTFYDFMGACDLKLIAAPFFAPGLMLDIDIRTTIRYQYSYIESAAIKIGENTLEVTSFGGYMLDGVSGADMPNQIAGFVVDHFQPSKNIHIFEITLNGHEENIVVKVFKDMVSVKLHGTNPERFHGSQGMLGAYDSQGLMLARDGATILEDGNAFAAEWQIRDIDPVVFQTSREPQFPKACQLPSITQEESRRRLAESSVTMEAAEEACAFWPNQSISGCIHDVLATGDLEFAAAGAF